MIAMFLPFLKAVFGGLIRPFIAAWTDYERTRLATRVQGFEAGVRGDAAVMQAALANDLQMNALKVQVYGQPINRLIMLIAGLPPALHFGLVFIDTILASKAICGAPLLGVPKVPSPYDAYQTTIVFSFFLVQSVQLGKSNVSAWLERK
jgi:hypothetical protein